MFKVVRAIRGTRAVTAAALKRRSKRMAVVRLKKPLGRPILINRIQAKERIPAAATINEAIDRRFAAFPI